MRAMELQLAQTQAVIVGYGEVGVRDWGRRGATNVTVGRQSSWSLYVLPVSLSGHCSYPGQVSLSFYSFSVVDPSKC